MFLSSDFLEKDLSGILSECQTTRAFANIISNIIDSYKERVLKCFGNHLDRIQLPAVFGLEKNYKGVPEPDFEYTVKPVLSGHSKEDKKLERTDQKKREHSAIL